MTEKLKYRLIKAYPKFELRKYDQSSIAEIEMSGGYKAASNSAFRHLFSYISGDNEASKKISMTAPVISTSNKSISADNWAVSFVMPRGSNFAELPNPTDVNVILREVESQSYVAIPFRGRVTLQKSQKKESELRKLAHVENFALTAETKIFRFDAPFKPGFMQYNEILIPIVA